MPRRYSHPHQARSTHNMVELHLGDCLEVLKTLPANSIDSIVTDPPAGISMMNKDWDKDKGGRDAWVDWLKSIMVECLRVLKPGSHMLVWSIPRTSHWTAWAIEDAGFEIRDRIGHIFGTGFPKSMDVGKKDERWSGWGTALKPAVEDWWLCRKPLEGTVAANLTKWGVGALNIDGCRVETEEIITNHSRNTTNIIYNKNYPQETHQTPGQTIGRFPAHLTHDGSDEVLAIFPDTKSGKMKSGQARKRSLGKGGYSDGMPDTATLTDTYGDSGSAARFFYCAKASKQDREEGCEIIETKQRDNGRKKGNVGGDNPRNRGVNERHNHHPTVKSTELMKYLCRLITPHGGIVLDPFMGSGSTGKAAVLEGFNFIGIEKEAEYIEIARRRIEYVTPKENPFIGE